MQLGFISFLAFSTRFFHCSYLIFLSDDFEFPLLLLYFEQLEKYDFRLSLSFIIESLLFSYLSKELVKVNSACSKSFQRLDFIFLSISKNKLPNPMPLELSSFFTFSLNSKSCL